MATDKDIAKNLLVKLQAVSDASIRSMMGDYVVYVDSKVVGQINEDELFIKDTAFGQTFAPYLDKKSPYPGAKPAFVVPQKNIDNAGWLRDFLRGTVEALK